MGGNSVAALPRLSIIALSGPLQLLEVLLVGPRGVREEPRPSGIMLGGMSVSVLPGDITILLLGLHRLPAILTMGLGRLEQGHPARPPLLSDCMLRRVSVFSSLDRAESVTVCRGPSLASQ